MIRIGGVELATNLLLSPIAGYYDLAFRRHVRPFGGLGLASTELVNPTALRLKSERSMKIVETSADDQPLAIQIYGSDPDQLAEAAEWSAANGATIVDINMGCPVPKIAGRGGGSGLLRSCPDAVKLAERVVKACPVPVTVKTRLGWEMGNLVAPDLGRRLADVGVAALTIHGRYGEQAFKGSADLAGIRAVAAAVRSIPVFGNGDVKSAHDAKRMLEQTGLGDRRDDQAGTLSGGNQQRINIAIGLLSDPAVLLLDEPSTGLDPRQRGRLWEFVLGLAGRGTTVIFSTHNIAEAERYAGRVLVIADGQGLFDGPIAEFHAAAPAAGTEAADFESAFVRFLAERGH